MLSAEQISISFVIPVYNVASYLAQCLDSLVSQSVSKEIIIINDGSTDCSLAIAEQYFLRYPFITIINQRNSGVSAARNAGLKLAKGRYIYFVDPDDWMVETYFDKIVDIADEHQVDVLKGTVEHSYEDGSGREQSTRPFESSSLEPNQYEVMSGYRHLNDMLKRDWYPSCCFGFFRTDFLRKNNLWFNEALAIGEDTLFITEILSLPKVTVIEMGRVFYHYRLRSNSLTTIKNDTTKFMNLFLLDKWFIKLYEQRQQEVEGFNDEEKIMLINLERIRAINYGYIYRSQYLQYSPELQAEVYHYFTEDVLQLMKKWLLYEVKL
ncbi:glycosyltransferase [Pelistega ratti]|uniref:glycosyltransferase n=1 Tax=Pelistega ratti TaxID=2652177 RepID=UPI00135C99D1|nr:glycosyltransferase [Pelistega ratti]